MKLAVLSILIFWMTWSSAQDVRLLSWPGRDYYDPEILPSKDAMVWMDERRVLWYAELDSLTGAFREGDGRQILVDTSGSLLQSWNAGEFLEDAQGWQIIYTRPDHNDLPQLHAAKLTDHAFEVRQLTTGSRPNAGAIVSRNPAYSSGKLLYFHGPIQQDADMVWADVDTPNQRNRIGVFARGFSHGDFFPGPSFGLVYVDLDTTGYYQMYTLTEGKPPEAITRSPFHKQNPMAVQAPEYHHTLVLACIQETAMGDSLLFFHQEAGEWTLVSRIGVPTGSDYHRFSSSEMFVFQGHTWVSVQIEDPIGGGVQPAEIWILRMDGQQAIRMDEQQGVQRRTDPEHYVTEDRLHIYYNLRRNNTWELWVSTLKAEQVTSARSVPTSPPVWIAPNPVGEDYIWVEAVDDYQTYQLVDLQGRVMLTGRMKRERTPIYLGQVPAGMYWLLLRGPMVREFLSVVRQ